MGLSERAVDYPRFVLVAAIAMCLSGIAGLYWLPYERAPRVVLPKILVAVPNPGASAPANERDIVRRIEEKISTLENVDYYASTSMNDAALVEINFLDAADIKQAKRDVQTMVDTVAREFPEEAGKPKVKDISFQAWPILQVAVSGGRDPRQLREVSESLKQKIEKVPGVGSVALFGGRRREIQINVDPHQISLYGLRYADLARAIEAANIEAPTGAIRSAQRQEQVRTRGRFVSVEQIANVPLVRPNGSTVRLGDLAEVREGSRHPETLALLGGRAAVALLVRAKPDTNTIDTVDAVKKLIAREQARLGPDFQLAAVADTAREIRIMLDQLGTSAAYGLACVFLILALALGWRNGLLVAAAMPFSLLTTAGIMLLAKHTIMPSMAVNSMVLFSVIVVVGLVVDGALVVGENIYHHVETGCPGRRAAKDGIREVAQAVFSSDLTTICAFLPMVMMTGLIGQFTSVMPIIVAFALGASMLVDHFVLPATAQYVMKPGPPPGRTNRKSAGRTASGPVVRAIFRTYRKCLAFCVRRPVATVVTALIWFSAGALVLGTGIIGCEYFPQTDIGLLDITFQMPEGTSIHRTEQVAVKIHQALQKAFLPGELHNAPVTTIGSPAALMVRLDNQQNVGPEFGRVQITLKRPDLRDRNVWQIVESIRKLMPRDIAGLKWRFTVYNEGPPVGADIVVRVIGSAETDLTELGRVGGKIERMLASIPGTNNVQSDYQVRSQWEVIPQAEAAALCGLSKYEIVRAAQFAINGIEIGKVNLEGGEVDIRLQNAAGFRDSIDDLADLPLVSAAGTRVSLGQVARVDRTAGPSEIRHRDGRRIVNVRCGTEPHTLPQHVVRALKREIRQARADGDPDFQRSDLSLEFAGENEERDRAMGQLQWAMSVGVILIFLILIAQFNSFRQSLLVLSAVPMSFVGVLLGLLVCDYNFSVSVMIGVLALAGIVVNDAIVLVEFIGQLRRAGVPKIRAIMLTGKRRLRPIFLTTITTVGGLLPMALGIGGGDFWKPLTISIIFGLSFSTMVTLLLVPAAYSLFVGRTRPGEAEAAAHLVPPAEPNVSASAPAGSGT